jgi:hypothetical protein
MNWNNMESIWKCQVPPALSIGDPAALARTFEVKIRNQSRCLLWRDTCEIAACLVVTGSLTYRGLHGGAGYWPLAIAIPLILGVMLFFVRERIRARRLRLAPDASLLEKLEADLAELRHQQRLLLNVAWYMAPVIGAWAISVATTVLNKTPGFAMRHELQLTLYVGGCAVLFFGIWVLNRSTARNRIAPRISELERMRGDLLS